MESKNMMPILYDLPLFTALEGLASAQIYILSSPKFRTSIYRWLAHSLGILCIGTDSV